MISMQWDAVNASLERAAARHGDNFREAYAELISLDNRDPRVCAAIEQIVYASDPGSMVLDLYAAMRTARASTLH